MRRRALAIFNVFTVLLGVCGVTISAVVLVGAAAYLARHPRATLQQPERSGPLSPARDTPPIYERGNQPFE